MRIPIFYIIITLILIIGLIDTAFTKIPSLARARWRMKQNKGAIVLMVSENDILILFLHSCYEFSGCVFFWKLLCRLYTIYGRRLTNMVKYNISPNITISKNV